MLIRSRADFDQMLQAVSASAYLVLDTEATGVDLRHGDMTIGLSLYTPADDNTYYFAWAHGQKHGIDSNYSAMKKWTAKKRTALAMHLYQEHLQAGVQAENLPMEWLEDLKRVWLQPKLHIGHNIQFDLTAFDLLGFPTPPKIADTMSMLSVVNSDWRGNPREGYAPKFYMPDTKTYETGSRGLKFQARLWNLNKAKAGIGSLETAVKAMGDTLSQLDPEARLSVKDDEAAQVYLWMLKPSEVSQYAEDDVRLTKELYLKILKWCEKWDDAEVLNLYNDTTLAVWQMQKQGFRIDHEEAARMIKQGHISLAEIEQRISDASGGLIQSANSPKQIQDYLNTIGVHSTSTDKKALEKIKDVPVLEMIPQARNTAKMMSTYVEKWLTNAVNGHVLPELNVGGTGTGRLSSSSDSFGNFQNVPRMVAKGDINPKMLLLPAEGCVLIEADYQALEMRLAAWVAETIMGKGADLTLTGLIERGEDMHAHTMRVSGIYDMLLNGSTEAEYLVKHGYDLSKIDDPVTYFTEKIARFQSKTTNFAAIYGAGVRGIVKAVGCTEQQARVLLSGYHRAYPSVRPAMEALERLALTPRLLPNSDSEKSQYLKYPIKGLDLKRKYGWYPASEVNKWGQEYSPRQTAARGGFNSVVQGTGGLLVLQSILNIKERFGFTQFTVDNNGDRVYDFDSGLVIPHITVHDSLIFSLRPQDLGIVPEICRIMTDSPTRPKLGVDISAALPGQAWGAVKKVKDMEKWINSGGSVRE